MGPKLAPLCCLLKLVNVRTLLDKGAVNAGGKERFKVSELGFYQKESDNSCLTGCRHFDASLVEYLYQWNVPLENGRTGEIRTRDQRIKSPLLYRLSYRPIFMALQNNDPRFYWIVCCHKETFGNV